MVRSAHMYGLDLGTPRDSFLDLEDFDLPITKKKKGKKKQAEIDLQQFREKVIENPPEPVPPPTAEDFGESSEFTGEI